MRIAVVGAGGVGGYFGGRLAIAGHEVAFIARGPHLAAMRADGLRVRSVKGDFTASVTASHDPAEIGPCEAILFCVKSYDTEAAASTLSPLLTTETVVVSLQNGIDNEEKLAGVIGAQHVAGGAAFIFSSITEPGVVTHTGGPARIVFGEIDGERSHRLERLLTACREAGIDSEIPADIRVVLWTKYAFICATAGMTAAVRLPLGDIRDCPESWGMFTRIVAEVIEVGRTEGVPLAADVVDQLIAFGRGLEPGSLSSLHHDMTTGKRMELETLHGTVIGRAARRRVAVPTCEAIYGILRPWALRNGG